LVSLVIVRAIPVLNRLNTINTKVHNSEKLAYYVNQYFNVFHFSDRSESIRINNYLKTLDFRVDLFTKGLIKLDDLTFNCGNSYFLSGDSGIGKSSFIDSIIGYRNLNNGTIFIDNKKVNNNFSISNAIYIEQKMTLINDNIITNIVFGGVLDFDKLNHIIELVDLGVKYNELINKKDCVGLSGGEIQRVLIARALYNFNTLIILDEATNALDSLSEEKLVKNVVKYVSDNNGILLFISHNKTLSSIFTYSINFNIIAKKYNQYDK
jgi:ABC-type transport system involved in cytochrome bd biosynthesis fused ATPase/permease subunit